MGFVGGPALYFPPILSVNATIHANNGQYPPF
jgi:hypothetical protein